MSLFIFEDHDVFIFHRWYEFVSYGGDSSSLSQVIEIKIC